MKIRFVDPDPRAGMVVELEVNRATQFIEMGHAEEMPLEGVEVTQELDHAQKKSGKRSNKGKDSE